MVRPAKTNSCYAVLNQESSLNETLSSGELKNWLTDYANDIKNKLYKIMVSSNGVTNCPDGPLVYWGKD